MCSVSISSYRQKRIFIKVCAFCFAFTLIFISLKPVFAQQANYGCTATFIEPATKEIEVLYIRNFSQDSIWYERDDPPTHCRLEVQSRMQYDSSYVDKVLIATTVHPGSGSAVDDQFNLESTRLLTSAELAIYSCLFSASAGAVEVDSGFLEVVGNKFLSLLPSSPDEAKIPTILSNMIGQGSLAANAAVEIYSGIWQFLTIIVFIKFYKLLPGKAT